jgi:hypothetical protein
MQATQFGGGFDVLRFAVRVAVKQVSQPQGFGLFAHGFTSRALSMASAILKHHAAIVSDVTAVELGLAIIPIKT